MDKLLFWAVGLYCICGAVLDWDLFFTSRRSRPIVKGFGRNGARIFYGSLGAVIIVLAILT